MHPASETVAGFAMISADVLTDSRLRARDVRVYGILACCRRGKFASVGQKRLAKLAHAERWGIRESIKRLIDCGHIEAKREGAGRTRFTLLSSWFVKTAGEAPEVEKAATPAKPKRELVRCPRCLKMAKGLLKVGWCRSCNTEVRVRHIVRDEIRKTA